MQSGYRLEAADPLHEPPHRPCLRGVDRPDLAAELRDLAANEQIRIPDALDYRAIAGLSNEMVERLDSARPETLAVASRIRGITPAALAAILVHAKRARGDKQAA